MAKEKSKKEPGSEVMETYFGPENLKLAYHRVQCWSERMVKDRFGIHAFGADLDANLSDLSERLLDGSYRPQRGFKYFEPKSSGTQRTKTLLFIDDAIVYQAIANVIARNVYDTLSETEDFVFGSVLSPEVSKGTSLLEEEAPNYFFFRFWKSLYGRFKDSVIQAIEVDKADYKFETDITGFFDSIPHYNLLLTLSTEFGVEDPILDLLGECLNAWSGTREQATPGVGIPQGPQPSALFANLLLHPLDREVIGEAFKFYRYMDDIHIYGYSEEELLDVLVKIDGYLKGHGLSINSKKTRIERIDHNVEDATVKSMKRMGAMVSEYEAILLPPEQAAPPKGDDLDKTLSNLADQTDDLSGLSLMGTLTDPEEIRAFWEGELQDVERTLPRLFRREGDTLLLADPERTDDIDFIRLSARYGTALRALREIRPVDANATLLPYWLFALGKYFWRAGNYTITLQYYRNEPLLRKTLEELYRKGKNYEAYRYHLITALDRNFDHKDKELREYFKWLREERSDLVRYALYGLIIRGSRDPQLLKSVKTSLGNERNTYIKLMVLDDWKRNRFRQESMDDLIKSVGL